MEPGAGGILWSYLIRVHVDGERIRKPSERSSLRNVTFLLCFPSNLTTVHPSSSSNTFNLRRSRYVLLTMSPTDTDFLRGKGGQGELSLWKCVRTTFTEGCLAEYPTGNHCLFECTCVCTVLRPIFFKGGFISWEGSCITDSRRKKGDAPNAGVGSRGQTWVEHFCRNVYSCTMLSSYCLELKAN